MSARSLRTITDAVSNLLLSLWRRLRGAGREISSKADEAQENRTGPSPQMVSLIRSESERIEGEISQLSGILNDAGTKLSNSFKSLKDMSEEQLGLVVGLTGVISDGEGDDSIGLNRVVDETERIMGYFSEFMSSASRESGEMVERMVDMTSNMSDITSLLGQMEGITKSGNLLALNATIEAEHAGEYGRGFGVVAKEVRTLSRASRQFQSEISKSVESTQRAIVDADHRMREIADSGGETTADNEIKLRDLLCHVTALDQRLKEGLDMVSSMSKTLTTKVGLAVMGLQFEDITHQLLEQMAARAGKVSSMAAALENGVDIQDEGELLAYLDSESTATVGVGTVAVQNSVDEGDVELF